ncbi:S1 family peptidase [Paracraurococcus lichenis]|uniref:Serine protease n=1 Tax=Paracraurococcus lichenis TaxID=3064888 RepID=A0ABT9EA92_9PROT|nr:serine protease [Paracraurococcus sp. LOR1-02]MDO9713124.1 serine protease [Paracraurococcus sp. LOR1-02]
MPRAVGSVLLGLAFLGAALLGWSQRGAGNPPQRPPEVAAPVRHVSGSGFLVAPGRLVTNDHVVLACRKAGGGMEIPGLPGPWRVAHEDPDSDLALLAGPETVADILPLSAVQGLARGTAVLALGYPVEAMAGRPPGALRAQAGQVLRAMLSVHDPEAGRAESFVLRDRGGREIPATWEDGVRFFGAAREERIRWLLEIDVPAAAGTSGGPVLDADGNVVGVIHAGDRRRGFSGTITPKDLRDFLGRAGVLPRFRPGHVATPLDWRRIEATAARSVHRILC